MPTSAKLLAELKTAASAADRPVARPHRAAARQARQSAAAAAARRPHRRHQRQGLGHRLPQGHARSRRQARARLHLAAPRALPRAHRARRRRRQGGARSARTTLVDVLTRTQATNGGDDVTQFEITTAAAFLAFAEHPADVLLLEVGLGGRLDATNVVARPALDVITPISLDHADKLGATLAKIAAREGRHPASRGVPAVIAQQEPEARGRHPRRGAARRRAAHRLGRGLRRLRAARPPRRADARSGCWTCRCRR